jgi:hypothetical protein
VTRGLKRMVMVAAITGLWAGAGSALLASPAFAGGPVTYGNGYSFEAAVSNVTHIRGRWWHRTPPAQGERFPGVRRGLTAAPRRLAG